ncbi:g8855 [Coccomyxa viridis]|uniref:G8855 protein n=1 Tax=Coccomyxa viridis TaxID=1274662 RepID=A0ABP1G7R5_9CHLO
MHLAAGIALAAFSTAALAARGLLGPALQQSTRCTDLTIEVHGLDQTTQAAFRGIAAEWANASDRYSRNYDAHTAQQALAPFQIPGSSVMSRCDYSTVAQDCSGNKDRALHPGSSPAGAAALPMSTKLQLSLSQPDGVMLMSASTGACATMKGGNWLACPNVTLGQCLYQSTHPVLPQPQYWVLSNHSIARVVGVTQPGYQWSATTISGANVSGALPSGMPDQEKWLVLPLPAPVNMCTQPEQTAPPTCRPVPYPVMIMREPAASNQGVLCAALLGDDSSSRGSVDTSGVEDLSVPKGDVAMDGAVTMHECHPSHASQIWQVMSISGEPMDLTSGTPRCPGVLASAPKEAASLSAIGG